MSGIRKTVSLADAICEESWKVRLAADLQSPQVRDLEDFLAQEIEKGRVIYPVREDWMSALNLTPFEKVRVVIVGQDPYHGPGQAHGLSFSVRAGTPFPPSLRNILKELQTDLGVTAPTSGDLTSWARQGVLLLNAVMTVVDGQAGAHQGKGWEYFTDRVIHQLNDQPRRLVFVLWGSFAQKKGSFIDRQKHLVIEAPHPSPLSSYRGFFGSRPFSKINDDLIAHGQAPIEWGLGGSSS